MEEVRGTFLFFNFYLSRCHESKSHFAVHTERTTFVNNFTRKTYEDEE